MQGFNDAVFMLARHVAVEHFDNSAFLLNIRTRTLTELDDQQSWILAHLDRRSSVAQLAYDYAEYFDLSYQESVDTVQSSCKKLLSRQFIRIIKGSWKGDAMNAKHYVQNPDVNLREEDEDGALLFNPDTDRVQLLNNAGLYIWKLCAEERTESEIVTAFKTDFDEVPEDEVEADVEEFISQMVDAGFIGTIETS